MQEKNKIQREKISFILPVCNEEKSLIKLHQGIIEALSHLPYDYELIFIDDGSTDKSFSVLKDLKKNDDNIKIYKFRRNFGKSAALSCGFEVCQGDYVISMDTDLQDKPEEIPNFINFLEQNNYDLVSGWKKNRKDPLIKIISSKIFNLTVSKLTGIKLNDFNCGFKIYKKEVVKSIQIYGELHRFLPVLAHQQGFKIGELAISHKEREHGISKYGKSGLSRIKNYMIDPINILLLTKYAKKPAHFFSTIGFLFLFSGIVISSYLSVLWFFKIEPIGNRPLLLLGILLIVVGVQTISMGFLGELIIGRSSKYKDQYNLEESIL